MKFAMLSDIHGNLPALQEVIDHIERWKPDKVIVAGDIVNRGPNPADCLNLIQEKRETENWLAVRGNHEDYVMRFADPDSSFSKIESQIFQCSHWTYQRLDNLAPLKTMPFSVDVEAKNVKTARVVHASMAANNNGVFPFTTDEQLRQKIQTPEQPAPSLLCVAHTHHPLTRWIDGTQVVNIGSVGMPFDKDHRASYGQFTWRNNAWTGEIIRLDYDRRQAEKNFVSSGFLEGAGPVAKLILDELRSAESRLFQWTMEFHALTMEGKITVEESVARFLEKLNISRR